MKPNVGDIQSYLYNDGKVKQERKFKVTGIREYPDYHYVVDGKEYVNTNICYIDGIDIGKPMIMSSPTGLKNFNPTVTFQYLEE